MKIKTPASASTTPVPAKKKTAAPVNTTAPTKASKVVKEAGATADAPAGQKAPSKHIGRTSGMRVMQYQDHIMSLQPKNKFTDEELAANWRAEFPETRCDFVQRPDIIKIVRRLFNERRHGKQEIFAPDGVVISKYVIEDGKRKAVADEPSKRGKNSKDVAASAAA